MPTTFTPTNVAMKRPMLIQNAQGLAGVEKFSGVINSKVDANNKPTVIGRKPSNMLCTVVVFIYLMNILQTNSINRNEGRTKARVAVIEPTTASKSE